MNNNNLIDIVHLAREHIENHDKSASKKWGTIFRAELNDNHIAMGQLRKSDLECEMQLGRKIFAALLSKHNTYICDPTVLAACLIGHVSHIELRSNFYTVVVSLLGIVTVAYGIKGESFLLPILMSSLLSIPLLIAKWHDDKYISLLRRVITHLQSFDHDIEDERPRRAQ